MLSSLHHHVSICLTFALNECTWVYWESSFLLHILISHDTKIHGWLKHLLLLLNCGFTSKWATITNGILSWALFTPRLVRDAIIIFGRELRSKLLKIRLIVGCHQGSIYGSYRLIRSVSNHHTLVVAWNMSLVLYF